MLARKRPKPVAKGGSRKGPADASQAARPQDASPGGTQAGLPSKRKIWIATSVAAVIVVAIGLGFHLLVGLESADKAPGAFAATFVGSDTCACTGPS